MRGFVTIRYFRRGRLIWTRERENLIVNAGLAPIAALVGGAGPNGITVVGFGSGTAAPQPTDTALTAPAYYKALPAATFPQAGQAQFAWTLSGATDTGAVGINVTELGFFANPNALALPITQASGAGAPALTMYAHILETLGVIASNGTYQGTWTFVA
jgi:hypothetical protein